jgi:hypothetical protein
MTTSRSPRLIIDEIRSNVPMSLHNCFGSCLHNHQIGFDECARAVYMSGEVHEECLDKGKYIFKKSPHDTNF